MVVVWFFWEISRRYVMVVPFLFWLIVIVVFFDTTDVVMYWDSNRCTLPYVCVLFSLSFWWPWPVFGTFDFCRCSAFVFLFSLFLFDTWVGPLFVCIVMYFCFFPFPLIFSFYFYSFCFHIFLSISSICLFGLYWPLSEINS